VSGERALPEQASLRYLKLEAKRRRAAGEFATLPPLSTALVDKGVRNAGAGCGHDWG
jgi:hypothetical protein